MVRGNICSVAVCPNSYGKAKNSGESMSFFTFPKDPKLRKEWIKNCYRGDKWTVANKRICSKHFTSSDFEDEMEARIMNTNPKRLKKDAIPSFHLLFEHDQPEDSKRSHSAQKEQNRIIETLIKEEEDITIEILELPQEVINNESDFDILKKTFEALQEENTSMKQKLGEQETQINNILKRKIEVLQEENTSVKQKLEEHENQVKTLQNHILLLNERIKKENNRFEEKAKQAFKDFLTPNQVEIALGKKTKARWTQEDLSRAFNLWYYSKEAYIYLKDTLHYPLPGISTLQQWASKIEQIQI